MPPPSGLFRSSDVGASKFDASSLDVISRETDSELKITHFPSRQFRIDKASDEVKTNHKWTDKQIRSRSEHREYDTPTAAPPTTMAALRNSNLTSNQSLLGDPPSGSQLVLSATNTTLYYSPVSDVTKTVKNWIEPYASDGSPNAAPILYRYLDEVKVNVAAWVEKTGYHFNGSSTLRSKSTFTETDIGTNYVYRGLELQEPSSLNNWTETFVPVESHTGGITQSITHTKPAADNTITVPNQGTTTTVEPGGEHHSGTTTLSTYLTVQKPLADFVGQFSTKTGYSSPAPTTTISGGANGGDYSQEGGGGTQDDGPNTGGGDAAIDHEIAGITAEIGQLMNEGLAAYNAGSLKEMQTLATGAYDSFSFWQNGWMFAIKPTAADKWLIFQRDFFVEYETRNDELGMRFEAPIPGTEREEWRFVGFLPSGHSQKAVRQHFSLPEKQRLDNFVKNAGGFTLHLVPGGNFADNMWGESNDSGGYIALVLVGDCLFVGGFFIKAGTRTAKVVNALGVAENLAGAGLAAYQGLGEDGTYGHGGDFILRLALAGLGTRRVLLEQKLERLTDLALSSAFSKNARRYIAAIERHTGFVLHPTQRARLIDNLRTTRYSRLTKEAGEAHRRAFTTRVRSNQIAEWERMTGQTWPRYTEDLVNESGTVLRKAGSPYDAHHVIENIYGGPHEWWNLTPARFPDQHQGGIHLEEIMSIIFP